ncbi:uncharacterized protein PAC_19057 [Phialocephala subalpina]|uniref:Uncharacterized protein n=1 Tax=Phialocephala subalpina TaxID=576137 RepID=A0A1L7XVW5_9HELO|nr:uncharacterized protein PAC_19057 [Phialocephala subalpina]
MDSITFYILPGSVSQPSRSSASRGPAATSLARSVATIAKMTDLAQRQRDRGDSLIPKQGNSRGAGNCLSDDDTADEFPTLKQCVVDAKKNSFLVNAELSSSGNARCQNQKHSSVWCRNSIYDDVIWMGDDDSDIASQIDSELDADSISEDADQGPRGGQTLGSGTTPPSNRPVIDRDEDETNDNDDVVHNGNSISCQARELQPNTEFTADSTKHVGRENADEPGDYFFDVFAEEYERGASNIQPKQPNNSVVPSRSSTLSAKPSERKKTSARIARISAFCKEVMSSSSTTSKNLKSPDAGEAHQDKAITNPNKLW